MDQKLWSNVDDFIESILIGEDEVLENALRTSDEEGLPQIAVSAAQGKLLFIIARLMRARRILEIGTLGGYSTIWLARSLSRVGRLITLEINPHHAAVAGKNIAAAGLLEHVDIRVGPALESLTAIESEAGEPFDVVFIDADKPSIPEYFNRSIALCHEGSVIIVDNVVRNGALADASSSDANVQAVRRLHEMIASDRRVSATTIQTVGHKGYDGFLIAIINGDRRGKRS